MYYKLTPISEPPTKEGCYVVTNGDSFFEVSWNERYSFHDEDTDCSGLTHYLAPVEAKSAVVEKSSESVAAELLARCKSQLEQMNGYPIELYDHNRNREIIQRIGEWLDESTTSRLDLKAIEKNIDEVLSKETDESLTAFLERQQAGETAKDAKTYVKRFFCGKGEHLNFNDSYVIQATLGNLVTLVSEFHRAPAPAPEAVEAKAEYDTEQHLKDAIHDYLIDGLKQQGYSSGSAEDQDKLWREISRRTDIAIESLAGRA